MAKVTKFIYTARETNETMRYTKGEEYVGLFVTEGYSNLLMIINDSGDKVIVFKFDFDYTRKIDLEV